VEAPQSVGKLVVTDASKIDATRNVQCSILPCRAFREMVTERTSMMQHAASV
jgi:hypothetical protein